MDKKLSKISFGLENCEVTDVDAKHIGNFYIGKFEKSIVKHYNSLNHRDTAKSFCIYLSRKADLKRLERCPDIVDFQLIYSDGSIEHFYVDWVGDSDYENAAQRVYRNSIGDMCLIVDNSKENDDWKIEKLNDISSMDMMWSFNN